MKLKSLALVLSAYTALHTMSAVQAQDGSLFLQPVQDPQGLTLQSSSFIYRELPRKRCLVSCKNKTSSP